MKDKELIMRKLNLIVVFNKNLSEALFCIRAKQPYKGLYNFVGGKVEENESSYDAAYRELFEETGISFLWNIKTRSRINRRKKQIRMGSYKWSITK